MGVNLPLTLMGDEFAMEILALRVLQGPSAIAELLVKFYTYIILAGSQISALSVYSGLSFNKVQILLKTYFKLVYVAELKCLLN